MSETSEPPEEQKPPEPLPATPEEPSKPEPVTAPAEEMISDREKMRKEFWTGFWVCLILNGLFGCYYSLQIYAEMMGPFPGFLESNLPGLGILWMAVNLFVLVVLAVTRRKIFEGVVAGVGLAFLISLVTGLFMTFSCFSY